MEFKQRHNKCLCMGAWSLLNILKPFLDHWDWIPIVYLFPNPCLNVWHHTCLLNILSTVCQVNWIFFSFCTFTHSPYDYGYYSLCPLVSNSHNFSLVLSFLVCFWLQLLGPSLGSWQASLKTQPSKVPSAWFCPTPSTWCCSWTWRDLWWLVSHLSSHILGSARSCLADSP